MNMHEMFCSEVKSHSLRHRSAGALPRRHCHREAAAPPGLRVARQGVQRRRTSSSTRIEYAKHARKAHRHADIPARRFAHAYPDASAQAHSYPVMVVHTSVSNRARVRLMQVCRATETRGSFRDTFPALRLPGALFFFPSGA